MKIIKKCGLPFLLNRYRGRKTFAAGAVLFLLIIYFTSSFIWVVDVKGNEKIETDTILSSLSKAGLKPGVLKYSIDTKKLVSDLMIGNTGLAWVGVLIKGTKASVEIVERVTPPSLVPKDTPCDIVALKDGVIKSIITKAGLEKVRAGETVLAGQVLITGTLPLKNEKDKYKTVHAIGKVVARTWYEVNCPVNTKIMEKERTGRLVNNYSVVLFASKINLFNRKVIYPEFEKLEIVKRLSVGEDFVFPFGLVIDRYYENNYIEREISLEDAKKDAADKAYRDAVSEIPKDAVIVDTSLKFIEDKESEGSYYANVIIECQEDIGIEQAINSAGSDVE